MKLTPDIIENLIKENKDLLTLKESVKYPGLFVLKYKKKVFYDNLWNDFLEEARGLVLDKDFNIVSRPFLKIYNYGVEDRAPKFQDDEFVYAMEKINGFMLAVTAHEGKMVVSTTGSLDSAFAELGREWIKKSNGFEEYVLEYPELTFIFECCDPSDPHIIHQEPGLYFLGCRIKESGILVPGSDPRYEKQFGFLRVPMNLVRFEELKKEVKTVKHEGFVIYSFDMERASKIKSPHYLTKKFLMRKNMDKIMSPQAFEIMDEEFYPLVQYIREVDKDEFFKLDELAKREYIEKWFSS